MSNNNNLFKQNEIFDYNYKNHNNNKKKKSEITICPKCHKYYPRNDEGYLTTINCECGLKAEFSPIKFEQTQYINLKKIKCDKCGKNKTEDECYYCCFCKNDFCKECKTNEHNLIQSIQKEYLCLKHFKTFSSYCITCNEDLCPHCKNIHLNKGHEIEDFDLDFKKREKQLKEIEKIFNEFNKVLIKLREEYDSICNIITKSFEIFKEKIVNYGKIRTRASQNSYKIDCFINDFNNIINISKGKNIFNTFYSIIQLSEKISNKKPKEKIIDNKDKINIINRNIDIKLFTKKNLQNKFIINKISNINFIRQKKYNDNNIIYEIKDLILSDKRNIMIIISFMK